ncbi:acyltransferase family protein, partial [Acinetobacter baumannii]
MRENNFDLLRFGLASIVVLFHTSRLSQAASLSWMQHYFSATFAVEAFFTVSGFLIFMSYERSHSLLSYAKKRARRIFPA